MRQSKSEPIAVAELLSPLITAVGVYTVTTDVSSAQGLTALGDCIDVKASHAILNLNGHNITGPGTGSSTGAGVRALHSATGAFVEGHGASISAFKYGMEIDANSANSDAVLAQSNVTGIVLSHVMGNNLNV